MAKKRRSLQSILVPPFFQPAASSDVFTVTPPAPGQRVRAHSVTAATSSYVLPPAIPISLPSPPAESDTFGGSPPSDLLDEDPFANLSSGPVVSYAQSSHRQSVSSLRVDTDVREESFSGETYVPRSPLAFSATGSEEPFSSSGETVRAPWLSPPATPPPTPLLSRQSSLQPRSSGQSQVRPAYTRPAFAPRPSLPSLSTLSQMNVATPRVKRGRVGATLPSEPWNDQDSLSFVDTHSRGPSCDLSAGQYGRPSSLETIRDSRFLLDEETLDTSSNEEGTEEETQVEEEEKVDSPHSPSESLFDFNTVEGSPRLYPTPSISYDLNQDVLLPPLVSEELADSPELVASSTPQIDDDENTMLNPRLSAVVYSRTSGDLSNSLDYDYASALATLGRTPSPRDESRLSFFRTEGAGCEEEYGPTRTLRRVSRYSGSLNARRSELVDWTTEMDAIPLSPLSPSRSRSSSEFSSIDHFSPTSTSEYGDSADFSSLCSDSDWDSSFMSGSPQRVNSLAFPGSTYASRGHSQYGEEEDIDEAESAADLDIVERFSRSSVCLPSSPSSEAVDGGEGGRNGSSGQYSYQNGSSRSHGGYMSSSNGGHGSGRGYGAGSGSGGRDGDDPNRRPPPRALGQPVEHGTDTEDEEESSDDYGSDDSPVRPQRAYKTTPGPAPVSPQPRQSGSASNTDDDVPLAQKIPTALKAQRTIRRQVRDEFDQRRRERRERSLAKSETEQTPKSPAVANRHPHSPSPAPVQRQPSTQPAFLDSAPVAAKPTTRPRTRTLPSKISSPFSVSELTKKLLGVQTSSVSAPVPPIASSSRSRRPSQDISIPPSPVPPPQPRFHAEPMVKSFSSEARPGSRSGLKPMRSFRRPRTAGESEMAPMPPSSGGLARSTTSATRRDEQANALDRSRSTRSKSRSRRPSLEDEQRVGRPSGEHPSRPPPMPPLPSSEVVTTFAKPITLWQQRIFVGNPQTFCQVEVSSNSTPRDVLEALQSQGKIDGVVASGWMLWEVCQDFGMERPIRSFELLSDVCGSWIADKTTNSLMAKRTPLAPKLSRAAIPTSSPVCGGFVQWEYKRGKWQKRWLELREHSLWLSKREGGKDTTQLCSVNNFDAYVVTRMNKAPKEFVFAVKSTDSVTYFESTADYMHHFSCTEKEGMNWLEKILLARSYVLYQSGNVLTSTGAATTTTSGATLSRAGTRKQQRPAQPLVNLGVPVAQAAPTEPPPAAMPVFEPGSLLAKRTV